MRYIFNAKKAIQNGASSHWATKCDGLEVKNRTIGDTHYMCYGEGLSAWCDRVPDEINKKIVITVNGNVTKACLYENAKLVKQATAKCSPEDTFDFNVGVRFAFDRLMGEKKEPEKSEPEKPEPKGWTGSAVCVDSSSISWTVGKIYSVKNGIITNNYGMEHKYMEKGTVKTGDGSWLIPVVE